MSNQIEGVITKVLPIQEGVSKSGNAWKRVEFVLTTAEQYPKTLCISVMGDKVDQHSQIIKEGNPVSVNFDIESREFNQRWYTTIKAYKIEKTGEAQPAQQTNYDQQAQQFFDNQPTPSHVPSPQPSYPNPNGNGYGSGGNIPVPQGGQGMYGYSPQQQVAPQPSDSLPF